MKPTPAKIVIGGIPVEEVTGIEAQVCLDLAKREAMGKRKFRRALPLALLPDRAELRAHLQAAYDAAFNHAVHLKRALAVLDGKGKF